MKDHTHKSAFASESPLLIEKVVFSKYFKTLGVCDGEFLSTNNNRVPLKKKNNS